MTWLRSPAHRSRERKRRNFPFKMKQNKIAALVVSWPRLVLKNIFPISFGVNCLGSAKCCFLFALLKPHFMLGYEKVDNACREKIVNCSLGCSVWDGPVLRKLFDVSTSWGIFNQKYGKDSLEFTISLVFTSQAYPDVKVLSLSGALSSEFNFNTH
jgi:hypothetical protein